MSKNKNILMLLNNHFTHDSRVLKEATSLIKVGYDLTLRCYNDEGLAEQETVDGIKVERILYTSRKYTKNKIHKLWLLILYFIGAQKNAKTFDVIHCHDLLTLPIGVMIKWTRGRHLKVIYDTHEYHTERSKESKWKKKFLKAVEGFFIKKVDHVICVSESIADAYARLYNIEKPTVVLNCPRYKETLTHDLFREHFGIAKDMVVFLYQGNFGKDRGIDITLDVFKTLKDQSKVIVFMGYGTLEPEIKKAAEDYDTIFHHPAVTQDVLLNYTSSADVGLCILENTCLNHYYCSPNKFFEYMMAGLPVIASDLYELSRIVNTHENGYIVQNGSTKDLARCVDAINKTDLDNKTKAVDTMKKEFCWEEQERKLLQIYASLF